MLIFRLTPYHGKKLMDNEFAGFNCDMQDWQDLVSERAGGSTTHFVAPESFFPEQPKENTMKRITLLLFQLFLGIFAGYAVLYDLPNKYLVVPLICLVCMYFLGKHPKTPPKRD